MAVQSDVATAVYTWDVAPGREAEFEEWARGLHAEAARQPGHLDGTWLRAGGSRHRYYTVVNFTDERSLQDWLTSPSRASWLDRLDKGVAEQHKHHTTGMETWFNLPGESVPAPPRWKMALVTFLAVYPLSLLYQVVGTSFSKNWAVPLRALVFPVIVVPLLTYILMPFLSRVLRRWLYSVEQRQPPATPE